MIIPIYNILILIISYFIIGIGSSTYTAILYAVLCIGSITFTTLLKRSVNMYPNVNSNHRQVVVVFCEQEYKTRLFNALLSWFGHSIMIITMANNLALVLAVTGVLIYKLTILEQGNKKVKEYKK